MAVAVGALAVWLVMVVTVPTEPVYQGKKLSVWLKLIASPDTEKSLEARRAVHRMGSNAVPILIRRFNRQALEALVIRKEYEWSHSESRFYQQMDSLRFDITINGLLAVGEPAIPSLKNILEQSSNEEALREASWMVSYITATHPQSQSNRLTLSSNAQVKVTAAVQHLQGPQTYVILNPLRYNPEGD